MDRAEIVQQYTVNDGIITSPGKFEGEMVFAPAFWSRGLEGFSDEDIMGVFYFVVDDDDRAEFPELKDMYGLALIEDGCGFVHSEYYDDKDSYDAALAADEKMSESTEDE